MKLDPSLSWRTATGMADGLLDSLQCEGYEVSRMVERVTGGWFAVLHYTDGRRVHRDCMSFDTGKAGCERWAMRHLVSLKARSRRKHLELVASQPWRGAESHRARAALERLTC